jgi:hypothetical protein
MNKVRLQELAQNVDMIDQLSFDECSKVMVESCFTEGWTPELLERLLTRLLTEMNNERARQLIEQMEAAIAQQCRTYGEDNCRLFPLLIRSEVKTANLKAAQKAVAIYKPRN